MEGVAKKIKRKNFLHNCSALIIHRNFGCIYIGK